VTRRRWIRRWAIRGGVALLLCGGSVRGAFEWLDRAYPFPVETLEAAPASPMILARDGRTLISRVGRDEQWRRPVTLDEISPWLAEATIAVEDQRFLEHGGVDFLAVARAASQNAVGGRVVSGASTLSMQVCKMVEPRPRTLRSKVIEVFRAMQLERLYSKKEILELYLNLAPYGGNLRGAECGAQFHFGKHAADLSLEEAALLAGIPQSPTALHPARHLERALKRRDRVFDALEEQGCIGAIERRRAEATPLEVRRAPRFHRAEHFAAMALARRPGGGTTTLDLHRQVIAEEEVERLSLSLPRGADVAVVVIGLERGDLLALVGSADPSDPIDGQVNGATARRSPGSTLKPFVYAAAFEAGIADGATVVSDAPLDFGGWEPANFDDAFAGEVTVTEALRRSLNRPALRTARAAGLFRVLGVLDACGITLPASTARGSGLALVTGACEARLLDITNAYATLGRDGIYLPVRLFTDEAESVPVRVLRAETCEGLHAILDSEERVPGSDPHAPHFCWKTGTSSGHRDAWAVGHSGELAIGVWVGNFSGAGDRAFIGSEAAEPLLWRLFETLGH